MSDLDRLAELNQKLSELVIDSEMFAQIINALPDGLIVIDEEGMVRHINQQVELIFGYPRGVLLAKPVHVLLAPELENLHRQHIAKFFINPTARPMNLAKTLPGRHRNGRVIDVQISIGPLVSEQGILGLALVRRVVDGK